MRHKGHSPSFRKVYINMQNVVNDAYTHASRWLGEGTPANYIPQLQHANPNHLSVCITDLAGKTHEAGDSRVLFSIQSISKLILLAVALDDIGEDALFSRVGMEPTGDPFNSIVRLETAVQKPMNPMINAGAIAVTASITGATAEERLEKILRFARKLLDNDRLDYDSAIYQSERQTGDKNRALAYMMKSNGIFGGDVEEHLEIYFKTCSLMVTCAEISKFAAILANDGVHPGSGTLLIEPFHVKIIRSLMATCGMYDASGAFALRVGIPSKSGVGGGILAVAPKRMGIGVFSPLLDCCGNSLCGNKALEYLSSSRGLSVF